LAEAYRNVAAKGARPLAVTDCLNFGSPEDPGVMWQFAEAVRGLADGCRDLGVPVTGGNVSFYNQTGSVAILPTPVVGVLGVLDDVTARLPMAFRGAGDVIVLLGDTRPEFDGSEWAHVVHGHLGGVPPRVDLAAERALAEVLVAGAAGRLFASAHDISDGGLAQALAECCLRGDVGARVELSGDSFVALFAESAGRALVSVEPARLAEAEAMATAHGVPSARLGIVGGDDLEVGARFAVALADLRIAHESTLPMAFG
jgi:phosphoribosylformylglycinamidine synthase